MWQSVAMLAMLVADKAGQEHGEGSKNGPSRLRVVWI